jgi:demethylspheroidene O-methyltransferase
MAPLRHTLDAQWRRWRTRLLASPRFQQFARAFPPFRPISRRRARQLFDLMAGFTYSQVLLVCVQTGLIDRLAERDMSLAELAAALGWTEPRARRLGDAAAALGLLEKTSAGGYGLGIHGAALRGNPWIASMIAHHPLLYADLVDPVALLGGESTGGGKLRDYWAYAASDQPAAAATGAYTQLMAESQQAVAGEVLDAYDFSRHRRLLDVGGGNGRFLTAVAGRHPGLDLMLFDLPAVIAHAEANPALRRLGSRVSLHPGSFLTDPLPQGADLITLVRIVHDHDDDSVRTLLRAVRLALAPEGLLLIAEPMAGTKGTEPVTDAYFNLYFAAMGQGRTRSFAELAQLGREAGFAAARQLPTRMPMITGAAILSPSPDARRV